MLKAGVWSFVGTLLVSFGLAPTLGISAPFVNAQLDCSCTVRIVAGPANIPATNQGGGPTINYTASARVTGTQCGVCVVSACVTLVDKNGVPRTSGGDVLGAHLGAASIPADGQAHALSGQLRHGPIISKRQPCDVYLFSAEICCYNVTGTVDPKLWSRTCEDGDCTAVVVDTK